MSKETPSHKTNTLTATVLCSNNEKLTVRDQNNLIYTFTPENNSYTVGDKLIIEYTGLLDENINILNIKPVSQE